MEGPTGDERLVQIPAESVILEGDLTPLSGARGLIVFAHGSGSSRHSPRNRFVAGVLRAAGFATLLFDLLTPAEELAEARTRHLRFDIALLAGRLAGATAWARQERTTRDLAIGYFGASTGAAAALVAAAEQPTGIGAIVSRGGRPDLAGPALPRVQAPTLLLVGGDDTVVIDLNRQALAQLRVEKELVIVPGASHLFEEPGALEAVARHAADWFTRYLESTA